jgi:hypothetical protein
MEFTYIKIGNEYAKIPTHLGFGKLDYSSIESTEQSFKAEYYLDNFLVQGITYVDGKYVQYSFLGEEQLSQTVHPSIEDAFIHSYNSINPSNDPRFKYLADKLNMDGDVFFQTPQMLSKEGFPLMISFPAGQKFCLRYIFHRESQSLKRLLSDIENNKFEYLTIKSKTEGILYYYYKTEIIPASPISVIDFVCPLAYISDYVNVIRSYNILHSGMEHRLVIQDYARVLSFDLELFLGNRDSDFYTYGIIYKKPENFNSMEYHVLFTNESRDLIYKYYNMVTYN